VDVHDPARVRRCTILIRCPVGTYPRLAITYLRERLFSRSNVVAANHYALRVELLGGESPLFEKLFAERVGEGLVWPAVYDLVRYRALVQVGAVLGRQDPLEALVTALTAFLLHRVLNSFAEVGGWPAAFIRSWRFV